MMGGTESITIKMKDINRIPIVANDNKLGNREGVEPLKRIRSNDCPKRKNEAVRTGETTRATMVLFVPGPLFSMM
jgi:hypothetical protein